MRAFKNKVKILPSNETGGVDIVEYGSRPRDKDLAIRIFVCMEMLNSVDSVKHAVNFASSRLTPGFAVTRERHLLHSLLRPLVEFNLSGFLDYNGLQTVMLKPVDHSHDVLAGCLNAGECGTDDWADGWIENLGEISAFPCIDANE
jgi:hypothetical protein